MHIVITGAASGIGQRTVELALSACNLTLSPSGSLRAHVRMHVATRKPLHDVFTALQHNTSIAQLARNSLRFGPVQAAART